MRDTIYALSTPPGRGGVAVVRTSGPHAYAGLINLSGAVTDLPPFREATLRTLVHPLSHALLDHALIIVFKGPASYTGEDSVEYHLHGGIAVVEGVLEALSHCQDHRMAQPGEFTRRAFENGKMDLTGAEAIADLIHAETEGQRQLALAQMGGSLYRLYQEWSDQLARVLALMEADLDFSDQDLSDDILLKTRPDLTELRGAMAAHLQDNRRGEILRDGLRIVILGAPNAGKSSLMNALARRDVAIVSPHAGTTRDTLDIHLNIKGYAVIVTDTAGLRPHDLGSAPHDQIEAEGIRRALDHARIADLKIVLFDGTAPSADLYSLDLLDDRSLAVASKADHPDYKPELLGLPVTMLPLSVQSAAGLGPLLEALGHHIMRLAGSGFEAPVLTRARHREAIGRALAALERSLDAPLPELAAEDVRLAIREIGHITGRVDVEDLLDMIFRDFCIGK